MFSCDVCKAKRRGIKRLSLYRLPAILVVHIKRFRFTAVARDKLMTDVVFPVAGLDLAAYISPDRPGTSTRTSPPRAGPRGGGGGGGGGGVVGGCCFCAGLCFVLVIVCVGFVFLCVCV